MPIFSCGNKSLLFTPWLPQLISVALISVRLTYKAAKMGFSERLMVKLTGAILMDVIMPNGGVHS
ncbi:hypothetical protein H6F86_18665 [Phormidium sp. FACHB-592]|uniref:Uncharacterized protein n=1 Tax=Stenomitos frigidus AS-A4 TaxID=2933935 RepID=A0ABV0KR18_9CYAN|nr:hypothetical protein [Phormidium sp. FACHB-592]MBD2075877.1 hypothetical protein [Phormidium sp. FACHB-592]